jgi:hypothetical protein
MTGQTAANVSIELLLNPTRFLAHRSLPLEQEPEIILREDTQARERLTRTTLDQQDNMLSDPTRTYGRATDILNLYLDKVTTLIDQTLRRYADEDPAVLQPDIRVFPNWSGFVVPRAEVYWEFSSEDAVDVVHQLQPHLNAAASEVSTSEYPIDPDPEGTTPVRSHVHRNAVAVEVGLGSRRVSLLVYAKAYHRVRFEIRYSRLRSALGRQVATSLIGEQLIDLSRLLQVAAETANRRLQRFRAALFHVDVLVNPGLPQLLRLASSLARAVGDNEDLADRIFSCLATTGGISSSSDPDWQRAIEALEQMGIIVRRRTALRSNHRRYALSQAYGSTVLAVAHAIRSAPTSEICEAGFTPQRCP